jgi:hypothetical protein
MTEGRRKALIDEIQEYLEFEVSQDENINEWEVGFLESLSKQLSEGKEISQKQKDKVIDILGADWL